jgi:hypothetical protein
LSTHARNLAAAIQTARATAMPPTAKHHLHVEMQIAHAQAERVLEPQCRRPGPT